ncbi:PREDICTED: uncharacterized protein LOC108776222 [Cyphomyrmex costatus]|uniref:Kazal-like domain-containing protein n=1 Tax=Cyphomyrmex costatus TaxID=456900 RepID=A0A195CI47_9HYME|nr:PREDICTED: uncharacterized protein LOC108776222 [Cyphomyrmex costatus]KYN00102.1 hypothetical protein ALC62_09165 [Cyphomyrmex costatus]
MLFFMLLIAAMPIFIANQEPPLPLPLPIPLGQTSPMLRAIQWGVHADDQFNEEESEIASRLMSYQPTLLEECMGNCPLAAAYDPVCGTDGVTYGNSGILSCAQSCGKDLTMKHPGMCQESATE